MFTPPTGNESGLVGYWNFNEGMELPLQIIQVVMEIMELLMVLHIH